MKNETAPSQAGQDYATAHAAHYKTKDLNEALNLYQGIMATHPDTQEAEYSRNQIQNIAKSVVPKQELLDAEMSMARVHLA